MRRTSGTQSSVAVMTKFLAGCKTKSHLNGDFG